jgi:hypothetical protein
VKATPSGVKLMQSERHDEARDEIQDERDMMRETARDGIAEWGACGNWAEIYV